MEERSKAREAERHEARLRRAKEEGIFRGPRRVARDGEFGGNQGTATTVTASTTATAAPTTSPAVVCAAPAFVSQALCCASVGDYPNTCVPGACACSVQNSRVVNLCNCPSGTCWNGTACQVPFGPCPQVETVSFRRYACRNATILAQLDYLEQNNCLVGDVAFNP